MTINGKAKKKKEFEWSKYQQDVFNFVKNGQGNVVIEAAAGSGKTTLLMKCLDFINPKQKVLLTAFNKDIVNVLEKKSKNYDNVCSMTMHSLGLQMLKMNFRDKKMSLDPFKYRSFITTNLKTLASFNTFTLGKQNFIRYIDNICKLIDLGRDYLCQTVNDLSEIENKYDIPIIEDEKSVAIQALNWGKNYLDSIDYTDMIWLPNALMCNPLKLKFDWIMMDEAQDANKAQRELLLKCRKINTRMIIVGDEKQSIYKFSGADIDSFNTFKSIPNTISLPLSISYRCADNIVAYAQQIVPTIEKNNDHRSGVVESYSDFDEVKDGDMVLCRNNAPLMKIYNKFIKEGKKCFIRGKDIGNNLKRIIKNTNQIELNADLSKDGVFVRLYDDLFRTRDNLIINHNIDVKAAMTSDVIYDKLDTINALLTLSDGLTTADQLIDKIAEIFTDRKKAKGISLSTIHKAKGLEADRVFIACKSLLPSKAATRDWEKEQEENLMYVAYTRAKNFLGFLDEKGFDEFDVYNLRGMNKLNDIEEQVNAILGKKPKYLSAKTVYTDNIIKEAKKISLPKSNTKSLDDFLTVSRPLNSGFDNLLKRKLVRRKR